MKAFSLRIMSRKCRRHERGAQRERERERDKRGRKERRIGETPMIGGEHYGASNREVESIVCAYMIGLCAFLLLFFFSPLYNDIR